MELCPNSGREANPYATNAKGINIEPYEAMCPACQQRVTVRISHEGALHGRTERWSEHTVSAGTVDRPAP